MFFAEWLTNHGTRDRNSMIPRRRPKSRTWHVLYVACSGLPKELKYVIQVWRFLVSSDRLPSLRLLYEENESVTQLVQDEPGYGKTKHIVVANH